MFSFSNCIWVKLNKSYFTKKPIMLNKELFNYRSLVNAHRYYLFNLINTGKMVPNVHIYLYLRHLQCSSCIKII